MPKKPTAAILDPSKPLPDDEEEVFSLTWVAHRNAAHAWRVARKKTGDDARNADVNAQDWLVRPSIKARIQHLREEFKKRARLDLEWLQDWFERMIVAIPEDAASDSEICQRVMTKCGPADLPVDKLGAYDRYAKLLGINAPEKIEITVDAAKLEFLARIKTRSEE